MTWLNFMSDYIGPQGGFGLGSWNNAFDTGTWSGNQMKVALQRQGAAGKVIPDKTRAEMAKYQGVGHANNPLGQYQGPYGNLGLTSYNAARAAGWAPQDIYDEIQSGRSGMYMPKGAMDQYNRDIADEQAARDAAKWRTDLQTQLTDLNNQINEPVAPPGVGYSAPSVVGKSGTRGANLKIAERGSRGGTKRWKRSSWSMPTVNTGGTSGKASNSSAVNV
mgnify:CR=1 FL=1